jgi:hypothetical protein
MCVFDGDDTVAVVGAGWGEEEEERRAYEDMHSGSVCGG